MNQGYRNIKIIICDDSTTSYVQELEEQYMLKSNKIKYINNGEYLNDSFRTVCQYSNDIRLNGEDSGRNLWTIIKKYKGGNRMRVGIMQPYIFPYIGYFQTINTVDKYVIYDDIQFIKGGWINRNRLLINGKASMITLKIKKENFNLNINEKSLVDNFEYENNKFLKSIELAYSRAPYFGDMINVIRDILNYKEKNLSRFITNSIVKICNFLEINTEIIISSQLKKDKSLTGQEKVIHVNKILGSDTYINAIGGMELYSKAKFKEQEIDLFFIKIKEVKYKQFNGDFIPNLSIIDVLMFNSKEEVKRLLNEYELV